VTEDNSKDLKVAVGVERSLQGSRRRNTVPGVPPPTIKEVLESGKGRGMLMKVFETLPRRIASNSNCEQR